MHKLKRLNIDIHCGFCRVLKVMNIVGFGIFMFVHVKLFYGLTGDNLCRDNDMNMSKNWQNY